MKTILDSSFRDFITWKTFGHVLSSVYIVISTIVFRCLFGTLEFGPPPNSILGYLEKNGWATAIVVKILPDGFLVDIFGLFVCS